MVEVGKSLRSEEKRTGSQKKKTATTKGQTDEKISIQRKERAEELSKLGLRGESVGKKLRERRGWTAEHRGTQK